jgi:hypothetical protein
MAKQTINLGTAPNGADGDTTRTGFDKANQNFTDLYALVAAAAPLPGALIAYSPTLNATSGGYGSGVGASGAYIKIGKLIFVQINLVIPTAGSAVNPILGIPFPAYASGIGQVLTGRDNAASGKLVSAVISSGGSTATVFNYDNSNAVQNGASIVISGVYWAA